MASDVATVGGLLTGTERLLEVGPGPGRLLRALLDAHPGIVATAVDRSPVAVRRTYERNAGAVATGRLTVHEGTLADLTALVGADARYDVVEQHLASFATLHPDNPVTETGVLAEGRRHGLRSRTEGHRVDR
ncbi:class I SAM-dependent methyltransferase, partial [Cellulomonas fimi]|uniref:class I SAM-dependent methyltransferase n=1 Tax=Cellulomonas fimi TaxID=1708 RepID=UPI00234C6CC5